MWGLCIPAACSPPAVSKLTRVVYEAATFSSIASDVTVKHCQEAGETLPYSTGFYIFMRSCHFMSSGSDDIYKLSTITTISTFKFPPPFGRVYWSSSIYQQPSFYPDLEQTGFMTIITKSFCMIKNQEDLIKVNKDEIRVMNGMRFITAAIIISIHVVFYMSISGIGNLMDVDAKNRNFGFASYTIVAVLSMVIPGVLTHLFTLPGVLFVDYGKYVIKYRETWEISLLYTPSYSRASPYLVGVAMGYFMYLYKPADYRKSVSKNLREEDTLDDFTFTS
ncbi:hypothetical protein HF086_015175 [Spodoptera exigua]|uniref:Uncharacterized protein n=1 Tax=Spodoptera exigua TaxID=7107 RepID=A0A922MPX1_SPOEX|nr:hypothetical protein HF086_015175 [Spodoptera exigua]